MNKIVGGLVKQRPPSATKEEIEVSWEWVSQSEGLIRWTFKNNTSKTLFFVLYRSGYYFGNAFYPVYEANPQFDVQFMKELTPLSPFDIAPPLGVVYMNDSNPIVCFVFTLSGNSSWSMDEGGWSDGFVPTDYTAYVITPVALRRFSIQYNPQQVEQYDAQTGTNLGGWSPNPSDFTVMKFLSSAPYVSVFPDEVITEVKPSNENEVEEFLNDILKFLESLLKDL